MLFFGRYRLRDTIYFLYKWLISGLNNGILRLTFRSFLWSDLFSTIRRKNLQNFVKFCLRVFFRVFKVRCSIQFDEKKLPKKGVYVSNHVSFLDPILLFAFLPGNPVFALNGHLYRCKWIRFLCALPIFVLSTRLNRAT